MLTACLRISFRLERNDRFSHSFFCCHCEERSDAAIHLDHRWIATAGCAGLAMTSNREKAPSSPDDEVPGVPGFRTWRGLYVFAFLVFVAIVAALALFTRAYA